jgi:hypothetical protein
MMLIPTDAFLVQGTVTVRPLANVIDLGRNPVPVHPMSHLKLPPALLVVTRMSMAAFLVQGTVTVRLLANVIDLGKNPVPVNPMSHLKLPLALLVVTRMSMAAFLVQGTVTVKLLANAIDHGKNPVPVHPMSHLKLPPANTTQDLPLEAILMPTAARPPLAKCTAKKPRPALNLPRKPVPWQMEMPLPAQHPFPAVEQDDVIFLLNAKFPNWEALNSLVASTWLICLETTTSPKNVPSLASTVPNTILRQLSPPHYPRQFLVHWHSLLQRK